jgi:hypothetical protein
MYLTQDKGGRGLKKKTLLTCGPRMRDFWLEEEDSINLPKEPTRPSFFF